MKRRKKERTRLTDGETATADFLGAARTLLPAVFAILLFGAAFAPAVAGAAVVINEINYHPDTDEEMEEFVELYNTSASAVDISNWRFVKGIDFTFPAGTTIAGHGYLVVARDQAYLASLFDISNVIGDFNGRLDDNGERLTLVDDVGTTVDTVRWRDQWPWPAAADGAGSSLELVNPTDDNDTPRNWRGGKTGSGLELFQHEALVFSHRHTPTGDSSIGPFRMSDVPITVDPTRTLQSIQLPTPPTGKVYVFGITLFDGTDYVHVDLTPYVDSDGFSFDGNTTDGDLDGSGNTYPAEELPTSEGLTACQAPGHGQVEWLTPDTTDGHNNCIRANGQVIPVPNGNYIRAYFLSTATNTQTINTYVTLGYSDGDSVQPYEITDWYKGIALPTHPTSRATPGRQNSVFSANTPPFIHEISHSPENPTSTETVAITARVEDSDGIAQVTLRYEVNEASSYSLQMFDDGAHGDGAVGDGVYGATIPAYASQSVVAYRIEARDGAGVTEHFPYDAEPEQALAYFVYDGEVTTNLPIEWIFISPANKAILDANPHSDETVPATFVDDKGRVYYHVQVRYRGAWARSWPKKCWKIYFNKGNDFDGHIRLNLNSNYNDRLLMREHLSYEAFRMAGYPHCNTRLINFRLNGAFTGVYVEVEQPDRDYLGDHGLDRDGSLYKANDNGHYPPWSNEMKLDPPSRYYQVYEKKTREWEDYTDLITWIEGLDATPTTQTIPYLDATMDLWQLTEYLAVNTFISNWDHVGKNHYDFRDSDTNKWLQLPWDLDRTWGEYPGQQCRTNQPLDYGREEVAGPGGMYSYLHDRYFEEPRLLAFYYRMLRRYCHTIFTEERVHAFADRMRALIGDDGEADFALWHSSESYVNYWLNWRFTCDYIHARHQYILDHLPAEGDVVINEFMTSNTSTIQDEAGDYDDWIELYNPKSTPVDVGGYYLTDNLSSPTRWQIPDETVIPAHGHILIWCDGEPGEGPLHANFRLDDDGEQIGLFAPDSDGNLPIDWWTYGPQVADVSAGRNGDGAWTWVAYSTPTPRTNNPPKVVGTPSVRINEWLASNHKTNTDENGDHDDWVELYNWGDEPVCIGGRFLTDNLGIPDSWMIPHATIIAPHGFLVIWCDDETGQALLHTNYRLDAQGDRIALYDLDAATVIDSVEFGTQQSDISQGRYPDGSPTILTLDRPTPGAPNAFGASAVVRWREY